MASGTPTSMAVDRPQRQAEILENRDVSKQTCDRPQTMEADTSAEEVWCERSKALARADQRGNSGGQTGQWTPGSTR